MSLKFLRRTTPILLLAVLSSGLCLAGRPLTVDDANVNDVGTGHVETWFAHQPGDVDTWTVAPAYGLMDGVEIGASWASDTTNHVTTGTLQAKFRLTPARQGGCNTGAVLGIAQANDGTDGAPYVNGLLTCNRSASAVHFNLGAIRPAGTQTLGTWGVAIERELGALTAHAEYFGQEQAKPTVQLGARREVLRNIAVDATLGQTGDDTLYSLGIKFIF
jgi:hypothetical protein